MAASTSSSNEPQWIRPALQGYARTPKFNLYHRWSVFTVIKDTLQVVGGSDLLHRFSEGCFGHLLRLKEGKSASKPLFSLMTRQIMIPNAPDHEVWFSIGGQCIRMSYGDYTLITGLLFGSSSFDISVEHDSFGMGHYMRFTNGILIRVSELLKKFTEAVVDHTYHEDYLKVANILALYLFVLGFEDRKKIDQWVWVLSDDLNRWNVFPWGSYSYGLLLHHIGKFPVFPDKVTPRLHFYGPVWALQMWAYEAIPTLGDRCTNIVAPHAIPRCLRRKFKMPSDVDFDALFTQQLKCVVALIPSDEERHCASWKSTSLGDPFGVRYIHVENPIAPVRRTDDGLPILHRFPSQPVTNPEQHYPEQHQLEHCHLQRDSRKRQRRPSGSPSSGSSTLVDDLRHLWRTEFMPDLTTLMTDIMREWWRDARGRPRSHHNRTPQGGNRD